MNPSGILALDLFGGVRIHGERKLTGRVVQRKRLAVLALLGAAPEPGLSRDRLVAFLWPEADAERGSHQLASCIYDLRRALGEGVVQSFGEELRLSLELVEVDVRRFTVALEQRDWERATVSYSGPFLDGFSLPDAPEFERWSEDERARFGRGYALALESLAKERFSEGNLAGGAEAWRALGAHDPFSSRVAIAVMEGLVASGDRAAAIRHAQTHAALLETELDAGPDSVVAALVERLRVESHAPSRRAETPRITPLPASDEIGSAATMGSNPETSITDMASEAAMHRHRSRRYTIISASSLALAGLIVLSIGTDSHPGKSRVANTGTPPHFKTAVRAIVDQHAYSEYLKGRNTWSQRSPEGLDQAVVHFRRAIALDPTYAQAHAGLAQAYVLLGYLGYRPSQAMFPKAKASAYRALELDSTLSGAYATLGQELTWERDFPAAEAAYKKAIALDSLDATAHQWYGIFLEITGRLPQAVDEARRGSELDPLSLQINNTYGTLLWHAGDNRGALRVFRNVVTDEPDSTWVRQNPWLLSNMARVYAANKMYPQAIRSVERALQVIPDHPRPLADLAYIYIRTGQRGKAREVFARADTSNEHYPGYRASLYAALGDADSAFIWFDRVREWSQPAMAGLQGEPSLDLIRSDPRYARLMRKLGLPVPRTSVASRVGNSR